MRAEWAISEAIRHAEGDPYGVSHEKVVHSFYYLADLLIWL